MDVFYKCACMPAEASVTVPDRGEGQDVVDWVEITLGIALGKDHRERSPTCPRTNMEYVKIPLDGADIGRRATRH